MKIRPLVGKDRATLLSMLIKICSFTSAEIDVAMELIDIVLNNPIQKDYHIYYMVDGHDQAVGYICYGFIPMTQGTFDLCWIAVDPDFHGQRVGSKLLNILEEVVKAEGGRMVLADASTIPHYEETQKFYLTDGFQEVARIQDYDPPGYNRITFGRRLK